MGFGRRINEYHQTRSILSVIAGDCPKTQRDVLEVLARFPSPDEMLDEAGTYRGHVEAMSHVLSRCLVRLEGARKMVRYALRFLEKPEGLTRVGLRSTGERADLPAESFPLQKTIPNFAGPEEGTDKPDPASRSEARDGKVTVQDERGRDVQDSPSPGSEDERSHRATGDGEPQQSDSATK